jgi:hypothetical protein
VFAGRFCAAPAAAAVTAATEGMMNSPALFLTAAMDNAFCFA